MLSVFRLKAENILAVHNFKTIISHIDNNPIGWWWQIVYMVPHYSMSEAMFEWDDPVNWHDSFVVSNIRISNELIWEIIVMTWSVIHVCLTLMGCPYGWKLADI